MLFCFLQCDGLMAVSIIRIPQTLQGMREFKVRHAVMGFRHFPLANSGSHQIQLG
jgi:hypothetical protein